MKKAVFILFLLLLPTITAFSAQYLEDNTLKVLKGHTESYRILLQNDQNVPKTFRVTVTSEVARLADNNEYYIVDAMSNKEVFFTIEPPKDTQIGQVFTVNYYIQGISEQSNAIGMGMGQETGYPRNFKVLVLSQNKPMFIENYTVLDAEVGKQFSYVLDCVDSDGDTLSYKLDSSFAKIQDNTLLYTPYWRGNKQLKIYCSDNVDTVEKNIVFNIEDNRFFTSVWFLITILFLMAIIVILWKLLKK